MDKEWKEIWQQSSETLPNPSVDIDLTKKPLGLVQKLERTIRWENRFNGLFVITLVPWLLFEKQYIEAAILIIIMIPTFYYYHLLLKKLSGSIVDKDVSSYLKKSYRILKTFMNHYKAASWIIGSTGMFIGFSLTKKGNEVIFSLDNTKSLIAFGIAALVAIVIIYALIYLIYGRKFKKLEELVKSIEEQVE